PKTFFEQRVGGNEIALVVARQKGEGDDCATQHISRGDLQKTKIGRVRESRNAYERQRARFRRHDGEQNSPPRDRAAGDKVILGILLIASEPNAERGRAKEVGDEHNKIEGGEIGLHFTALALSCRTAKALRRE